MAEKIYQEKRRFVRIPIETRISFTVNDNENIQHSGTSQNLSAGGIYITTTYALKLGNQIKIVLITSENDEQPLIAEGKVVRCKFDKKNSDLFHVSIEFTETHEYWIQTIVNSKSLAEKPFG